MKLENLQAEVTEALLCRGHSHSQIEQMTWDQAFDEFCNWEGLKNWGPTLRRVMANLKGENK